MWISNRPAAMMAGMSRLTWHPPPMTCQIGSIRTCDRRTVSSGASPCSQNNRRPPGRNARRATSSAATASGIVQRRLVTRTASTLAGGQGERLGGLGQALHRKIHSFHRAPRPREHAERRFQGDQFRHARPVIVRQVQARTETELGHHAACPRHDEHALLADRRRATGEPCERADDIAIVNPHHPQERGHSRCGLAGDDDGVLRGPADHCQGQGRRKSDVRPQTHRRPEGEVTDIRSR
jgi:hypothetical protein